MPDSPSGPFAVGCRLRELSPRQQRAAVLVAVAVAAPFVVAALQARADGWYPIGDSGTMLTVTRQVFTAHPPLTGEIASSIRYGVHAYHPGPLVYYVLAPFVALLGGVTGMLAGAAAVSIASVVLIGYVALRTAGVFAALWAWASTLLMVWALGGTAYVYTPFKTVSAVLVLLLFLHLCAALVSGKTTLLPLWVLAASYPAAATLRYLLPVAAVAATTVAIMVVQRWRRSGDDAEIEGPAARGRLFQLLSVSGRGKWSIALAVAVAVACWWAPVYEAVSNRGGNLLALYRGARAASKTSEGIRRAAGEQARALLLDPAMTASELNANASGHIALAVLLLLGLGLVVVVNRRRLRRPQWAFLAVAASSLGFMLVSLATIPGDEGVGAYRILGAAPVAAFILFTAGMVVAHALAPRLRANRVSLRRVAVAAVAVVALAVAVPGPIDAASEQSPWAFDATRTLVTEADPHLRADGEWTTWVVGGIPTATVFVGFKSGLEAAGVDTGADAGALALGVEEQRDPGPAAGVLVLMPSFLPAPEGDWTAIATYEPPDRSSVAADRTARRLVAFALQTDPRPLDAFIGGLSRLLCPELAAQAFQGDCPAARDVLASDNPVAALPLGAVALTYLTQFGEDAQFPVIDGPVPPRELLDAAHETWDDVPLTVFALSTPSG